MKRLGLVLLFLTAISPSAFADQIFSNCTSPSADVNPPASGSLTSVCGPGFVDAGGINAPVPPASALNSIKLVSRYAIALQLGGNLGSAEFRHATSLSGVSDFDNTGFDLVNSPLEDKEWGGGADSSGTFFNCSGNQAACAAIVAAINSGVSITADFQNTAGAASGISVDFVWIVDYNAFLAPEPTSLMLLGIGVLALELGRRSVRRS